MFKSQVMCLIALVSSGCGGRVETSAPCSEVAGMQGAVWLEDEGWVVGKEALNGDWLLQVRPKGGSQWSPPVPIQWEITLSYLIARSGNDEIELLFPITAHPELGRDGRGQACVLPYPRCTYTDIAEEWGCEGWYERTGVAVDWSTEYSASQPLADLVSPDGGELEPLKREDPELVLTSTQRLTQIDVTVSYQVDGNSRIEEVELRLAREPETASP